MEKRIGIKVNRNINMTTVKKSTPQNTNSTIEKGKVPGFPKDFWGKAISSMTLMIGENGSGKTTILCLLCIWLCQLAVG